MLARFRVTLALLLTLLPAVARAQGEDPSTGARTITATSSSQDVILGPLNGRGSATVQLLGTWTGTYPIQGSLARNCATATYDTVPGTSNLTANGLTSFSVSGIRCVRIPASGWSSGTTTVIITASSSGGSGGDVSLGDVMIDLTATNALLTEIEADTDTLIGHVDTLETVFGTASLVLGTQADNLANTSDGLQVTGLTYVFDGSTWDRWTGAVTVSGVATDAKLDTIITHVDTLETVFGTAALVLGTQADNVANTADGFQVTGFTYVFDGSTWDRWTGAVTATGALTPSDNFANPTTAMGVMSFQMCWDGATWDRCTGAGADTELPAAAALADNTANPTVPGVAAFLMCFDGSTWDRCPTGDGGAGAVSANTSRVTLASDDPIFTVFGTSALVLGTQADNLANTSDGLQTTSLMYVFDGSTWDRWTGVVTATNLDVQSGGADLATAAQLTTLTTYIQPSTGAIIRSDNTNNDDETQIKATAGVLYAISGRNSHASADAYVRCTNLTAANTTPGSSTIFYEMVLPFGGGFVQGMLGPAGRTFDTALTCYVATGEAATDATDAAQDDVVVNIDYR